GCSLLYAARLIAGHGSRPSHPKTHLPHSGILEAIVCQINSRTVVPRDRSPTSPPGPSPVPAATPTPPAPRRSIHLLVVRMAHPAAATPREEGAAAVAAGPTMAAQGRNTRSSRSCLPLVCPRRSVVSCSPGSPSGWRRTVSYLGFAQPSSRSPSSPLLRGASASVRPYPQSPPV